MGIRPHPDLYHVTTPQKLGMPDFKATKSHDNAALSSNSGECPLCRLVGETPSVHAAAAAAIDDE
jgi:hypothetical protein